MFQQVIIINDMNTIKEAELRAMIKELLATGRDSSAAPYVPPNVPNYGNPVDDVVNVNANVDHNLETACDVINAERDDEAEQKDNALYVENLIRKQIRSLLDGDK